MSNLKEPLLRVDDLFEDSDKNKRLGQTIEDIYKNASFKDGEIETVLPSVESMKDGEAKFVDVAGTVRRYWKLGNNLYYADLTKV